MRTRTDHRQPTNTAALALLGMSALMLPLLAGCRAQRAPAPRAEMGSHLISFAGGSGVELDADSIRLAGVTTATAQVRELRPTVQPTGQVAATDNDAVQVTARLPGKIVATYAGVGTLVRQGQLVARVDSVDLAQAEATYQTAL